MSLLLVGVNHKNAPLAARERLAFSADECAASLPSLVDGETVREALILSTCNRVEFLVEAETEAAGFGQIVEFIARHKNIAPPLFEDYLYQFTDDDAARHLFRVAASLDSMIVGETQILGQVRAAYKQAAEANTARRVLHKLLHHAFQTAKRVRTETNIAHNAVSVSSAAAEMAGGIFGSLENKTILLIGAGEMAELAAKHLIEHGAQRIFVANRTFENAVKLAAQFDGEAIEFGRIGEILPQADIVISSTNAASYLITPEMTEAAQILRQHQPTLFIDISVPRNIAPEVRRINGIYLADVDALQTVVASNLEERQREAERGEIIVNQEVGEFWQSLKAMNFGENLGALRTKMQNTARRELDKQRHKLGDLTPEQSAAVEKILLSTVNQIAHPILYGLRRSHEHGASEFAETLCELMNDFQ